VIPCQVFERTHGFGLLNLQCVSFRMPCGRVESESLVFKSLVLRSSLCASGLFETVGAFTGPLQLWSV
jgi:hypothetical protein